MKKHWEPSASSRRQPAPGTCSLSVGGPKWTLLLLSSVCGCLLGQRRRSRWSWRGHCSLKSAEPWPHTPPTAREGPTESHVDCGAEESGTACRCVGCGCASRRSSSEQHTSCSLSASTQWGRGHSLQPLMRPGLCLGSEPRHVQGNV